MIVIPPRGFWRSETRTALGADASIEDTQATLAVIPYFAPTRRVSDPRLLFEWAVNGTSVAATIGSNEITIQPTAHGASVSVSLSHDDSIYFGVSGLWKIALASSALIKTNAFAPSP